MASTPHPMATRCVKGGLTEACVKGEKQAAEQLVKMKSLMKNMHNKNHFQGRTWGRWDLGQTQAVGVRWSQQNKVDLASQGNALLRAPGEGFKFPA